MAKKSKLLAALDAQKGRDHNLERQKKLQKQAVKRKRVNSEPQDTEEEDEEEDRKDEEGDKKDEEEEDEEEESEDASPTTIDISGINDSDSESCSSLDPQPSHPQLASSTPADAVHDDEEEEEDENEEEDEDAIPFSDIESLSSTDRADIVPHQRLTINNTSALLRALKSIALPLSTMPFSEHQTLTAPDPIPIPDINDDLTRELAFYKQCLDAATRARTLLVKEGVPFSRPADYFAEMVKTDEHMGKIKLKMTEAEAGKRAAAEARKQRDLKRFGKQVQVAKLQERDKAKRETLDKINLLKRKRRNTDTATANEEELFDVALEGATTTTTTPKTTRSAGSGSGSSRPNTHRRDDTTGPRSKRQKKDGKFGFGGKKRFAKSGDAASSGDLRGFSVKGMKGRGGGGAKPRLGKSRRAKRD